MSSTARSQEVSHDERRRPRRRRWAIWITLVSLALILWQLNLVIWGVSGLVHVLRAGEAPRAFLASLLDHLYRAVRATVDRPAK